MDPEEYLGKLNTQQRAAVEYCDGPQLVIAGAGSGKTRVLTYKIVHLLAHGYEPWRILALTFTNKAAGEMRRRIRALIGDGYDTSLICTYHGFCNRLLREHPEKLFLNKQFQIIDSQQQKAILG